MKVESESEVAQLYLTLHNPMDCSLPGSSIHGIFPGKSTGVGCHRLLQVLILRVYQNCLGNFSMCTYQSHSKAAAQTLQGLECTHVALGRG